jgi:hypothetical protein
MGHCVMGHFVMGLFVMGRFVCESIGFIFVDSIILKQDELRGMRRDP